MQRAALIAVAVVLASACGSGESAPPSGADAAVDALDDSGLKCTSLAFDPASIDCAAACQHELAWCADAGTCKTNGCIEPSASSCASRCASEKVASPDENARWGCAATSSFCEDFERCWAAMCL